MPCLIKPDMHHTCLRIMPCYVLVVYYVVCFFPVLLLRVGSDNVTLWGPVQLRPFVFFMDTFFFLAGFQARWLYPWNHFYICLLSCSLFCYAYAAIPITCLSCLPYFWTKPLTHLVLANRCLAMLPLCSAPSYSVVSCRSRLKFVPCWNMEMLFLVGTCLLVGISQYILFN